MANNINGLTPQDIRVYQAIQNSNQPLTAKAIGTQIDALPHAVYRSINALSEMSLINTIKGKPRKYALAEVGPALQQYLINQSDLFTNTIGEPEDDPHLNIKFLRNRDDLITQATDDTQNVKQEIFALVSGHEIPTELTLAYKQAIARGVSAKLMFQIVDKNNQQLIKTLDKLGVEIRKSNSEKMRIITFDNNITHLMSFENNDAASSLGIRLSHQPITAVFKNVLEKKWEKAQKIA